MGKEPKNYNEKLIESTYRGFEKFIEKDRNRIIFINGKFGTGKTSFLDFFFSKNRDKYKHIIISPVHYSVVNTYDVFQYIKLDIIHEIVKCEEDWRDFSVQISQSENISNIISSVENTANLFNRIVEAAPIIGKPIIQIAEALSKLSDSIQKNKTQSKEKQVIEELKRKALQSILYEFDILSEIIALWCDYQKQKDILPVLVIDDLDRIDPEHVFRILNVLSAHTDNYAYEDNKFGFSKIITVGSRENLKSIFHHKYGPKTDFEGYFYKFYSTKPFDFSAIFEIEYFINGKLNQMEVSDERNVGMPYHRSEYKTDAILEIILHAIHIHEINLRTIVRNCESDIDLGLNDYSFMKRSHNNIHPLSSYTQKFLYQLNYFFGGTERLINILSKLDDLVIKEFTGLIPILLIDAKGVIERYKQNLTKNNDTIMYPEGNYSIHFHLQDLRGYRSQFENCKLSVIDESKKTNYNIFKSLAEVLEIYQKNNIQIFKY